MLAIPNSTKGSLNAMTLHPNNLPITKTKIARKAVCPSVFTPLLSTSEKLIQFLTPVIILSSSFVREKLSRLNKRNNDPSSRIIIIQNLLDFIELSLANGFIH